MERKLGKGLGALIPEKTKNSEGSNTIKVNSIKPNKLQPRKKFGEESLKELMESIREKGVIQPVIVREDNSGGYELIAGERRFRAVKELGFEDIPAIVKKVNDSDSLEIALIENIQREELNALEEAHAYMELIERFNFSQERISKAVGKDKSTISNTLRILSLPKLIQNYISDNLLTLGHAKAILSLPTERTRIRFAKRIMRNSLSVRQAEELIKQRTKLPTKVQKDADLLQLEEELQYKLGTRVKIIHGKKRGRIEIQYFSNEDLDRIINLIKK